MWHIKQQYFRLLLISSHSFQCVLWYSFFTVTTGYICNIFKTLICDTRYKISNCCDNCMRCSHIIGLFQGNGWEGNQIPKPTTLKLSTLTFQCHNCPLPILAAIASQHWYMESWSTIAAFSAAFSAGWVWLSKAIHCSELSVIQAIWRRQYVRLARCDGYVCHEPVNNKWVVDMVNCVSLWGDMEM